MECTHPNAKLVGIQSLDFVNAFCPDCEQGWRGPSYDWVGRKGIAHKLPRWVRQLIEDKRGTKARPK